MFCLVICVHHTRWQNKHVVIFQHEADAALAAKQEPFSIACLWRLSCSCGFCLCAHTFVFESGLARSLGTCRHSNPLFSVRHWLDLAGFSKISNEYWLRFICFLSDWKCKFTLHQHPSVTQGCCKSSAVRQFYKLWYQILTFFFSM